MDYYYFLAASVFPTLWILLLSKKKIKYASIIFSGKVIFEKKVFLPHLKDTTFFPEEIITDPELMDFYKIRMVRVELVQKYKGKNKYFKDTLDVYIEDVPLTTNCNLIFQPGKEYLFYVLRRNYVMDRKKKKYNFIDVCKVEQNLDPLEIDYLKRRRW